MTTTKPATDALRFSLHHREAGEGPTIILVHGYPTDGRVFDEQLHAAGAGSLKARVIAVDLPGFGQTPFDDDGTGAPDVLEVGVLAESLANLIIRLCGGPVVVGGVAIGGYVAVDLAARHPELVRGLVVSGTTAAPDAPAMAPRREAEARMALERGSGAMAEELARLPLGPHATDAQRQLLHDLIASADPRGIAALVRGLASRPDPTPAFAALKVPVLVLAGSADPFVPADESARLASVIPHARLVTLAGIGHVIPLEAPAAYTAALRDFLASLG